MNLYTAEIKRLEERLEETPDDESVIRRLRKYQGKRQLQIEKLKPQAIEVINKHLNKTPITYNSTGAQVWVLKENNKYIAKTRYDYMVFFTIESLAEFLIVSEDLFV